MLLLSIWKFSMHFMPTHTYTIFTNNKINKDVVTREMNQVLWRIQGSIGYIFLCSVFAMPLKDSLLQQQGLLTKLMLGKLGIPSSRKKYHFAFFVDFWVHQPIVWYSLIIEHIMKLPLSTATDSWSVSTTCLVTAQLSPQGVCSVWVFMGAEARQWNRKPHSFWRTRYLIYGKIYSKASLKLAVSRWNWRLFFVVKSLSSLWVWSPCGICMDGHTGGVEEYWTPKQ